MRKPIWGIGTALILASGPWLYSAPTIGTTAASPTAIQVNTPTVVTITAQISDATLIPHSVNLIRFDQGGKPIAILGELHDDGMNGDATAGDGIYTIQVQFNEPSVGPIPLRVSAAFKGLLRRVLSQTLNLSVQGGSNPAFMLFSNKTDPHLLRAETPDGHEIDYFGLKDSNGLAKSVNAITVRSLNTDPTTGSDLTTYLLDDQARPTQIRASNGVNFNITWESNSQITITALSPDGSKTISSTVNLQSPNSAQSSASRSSASAFASTNAKVPAPLDSGNNTAQIYVTRCNQPVNDADVTMTVTSRNSVGLVGINNLQALPASHGTYTIFVPAPDPGAGEQITNKLESVGLTLGLLASAADALTPVGAAAVYVKLLKLGASDAILTAWLKIFAFFDLYDKTLGVGIQGGPDVFDRINQHLAAVIDSAAFAPVSADVTVSVPGILESQTQSFDAFPLTQGASFTFAFLCQPFTLTVNDLGLGSGTVTSQPPGIVCGPTCSASFESGTTVTLNAVTSQGSSFGGWNGACAGTNASDISSATVNMNDNEICEVTFNSNASSTLALSVQPTTLPALKQGQDAKFTLSVADNFGTPVPEAGIDVADGLCNRNDTVFTDSSGMATYDCSVPTSAEGTAAISFGPASKEGFNSSSTVAVQVFVSLSTLHLDVQPTSVETQMPGGTFALTVSVTDDNGNAVEGAAVGITGSPCSEPTSVTTDDSGTADYSCTIPESIVAGNYMLTFGPANKNGYNSSTAVSLQVPVKLPTLDLTLQPATIDTQMPGDTFTLTLSVTDNDGNPVAETTIPVSDPLCNENNPLTTDLTGSVTYTCTVPESATSNTYTITFGPASKNGFSSSSIVSVNVFVNVPTLTLDVQPVTVPTETPGSTVTFELTVTDPTGAGVDGVTIAVNDGLCGLNTPLTTDQSGNVSYSCAIPISMATGTYTISFGPASKGGYNNSNVLSRQVFVNVPTLNLDVEPFTVPQQTPGQTVTFTVTVTDPSGSPVEGAVVGVDDGLCGVSQELTTDFTGTAPYSCPIPDSISSGAYTIFFGPATKSGFGSSATTSRQVFVNIPTLNLDVQPQTVPEQIPGQTVTFTVTVTDPSGNAVEGAVVGVDDGLCDVNQELTTDFSGNAPYSCQIPGSASGVYTISFGPASKSGFSDSSPVSRQIFVQPTFTVSVDISGDGSVNSTDGKIDCPFFSCSSSYVSGSFVTLVASPGFDSTFSGWGGNCFGSDTETSFFVSDTVFCTAVFTSSFGSASQHSTGPKRTKAKQTSAKRGKKKVPKVKVTVKPDTPRAELVGSDANARH